MQLTISGKGYSGLCSRIQTIERNAILWGYQWARESLDFLNDTYLDHLRTQGRGGEPPPLSPVTLHLYQQVGDPDGSGIRNHIRLEYHTTPSGVVATFGILAGRPTIVAKVQDRGATIPVSPKMRGFLAAHGVYLRPSTAYITVPGRHSWEYSLRKARHQARVKLARFWNEVMLLNLLP